MYLYNYPEFRSVNFYQKVIEKVTRTLKEQKGIVSVYQIGGISSPGISDLDIVAVFEDGVSNYINPINYLQPEEEYLFTHSIFGIHRAAFLENQKYSLFHNYKLLWGENLVSEDNISEVPIQELKKQIAVEYLISNIISRTVEYEYGTLSLRNIFLSVKAIEYDLMFLNVSENEMIYQLVNRVKNFRNDWFNINASKKDITNWFHDFYKELIEFQKAYYKENQFSFWSSNSLKVARNIFLKNGEQFQIDINGFTIPSMFASIHPYIKKINPLLNRFIFSIPINTEVSSFMNERTEFLKSYVKDNQTLLPNYATMMNPTLYLICKRSNF